VARHTEPEGKIFAGGQPMLTPPSRSVCDVVRAGAGPCAGARPRRGRRSVRQTRHSRGPRQRHGAGRWRDRAGRRSRGPEARTALGRFFRDEPRALAGRRSAQARARRVLHGEPERGFEILWRASGFRISDWIEDRFVFIRCGYEHHSVNFARGCACTTWRSNCARTIPVL
jgi:hypothetical protein